MSHSEIDEQLLTAYALNELSSAEKSRVEAWLETSPSGRQQLKEIQDLTTTISRAFQVESQNSPPFSGDRVRKAVETALQGGPAADSLTVVPHSNEHAVYPVPARPSRWLALLATVSALSVVGYVSLQSLPTDVEPTAETQLSVNGLGVNEDLLSQAVEFSADEVSTWHLAQTTPQTGRELEQLSRESTPPSETSSPAPADEWAETTVRERPTFHPANTELPKLAEPLQESIVPHGTVQLFSATAPVPPPAGKPITATDFGRPAVVQESRTTTTAMPKPSEGVPAMVSGTARGLTTSTTFESKVPAEGYRPAHVDVRYAVPQRTPTPTMHYYPNYAVDQTNRNYLFRHYTAPVDKLSVTNESYAPIVDNDFISPSKQPYSTFSIDVDTASYTNVRRFLHQNKLPPVNAVRLEELINAFTYSMQEPTDEQPIAATLESGPCPWEPKHRLVRIGLKAKEIKIESRPATSLVFLIDVSGSMKDQNKLPLAQAALRLLVQEMKEDDRIAIVTYANDARVVLESTDGTHKEDILHKIDSLSADGSTNGEDGLSVAYQVATQNLIESGANRVILCTDGDFNVGTSDDAGVFKLIEEHRETGVFLSVLGFGTGNLKDSKLEGLADRGNGQYVYIDQLEEARRMFVEQLTGTLFTIAKDVKLQVEFNPQRVASYRLLGYENRSLAAQDFNNDKVDAGDVGAGQTVTALYEIVPTGGDTTGDIDEPRYQPAKAGPPAADEVEEAIPSDELLFVKLRYKQPQSNESTKLEFVLKEQEGEQAVSRDFRWAASVASFGMLLRDAKYKGQATWESLLAETRKALASPPTQEQIEFVDLVLRARGLADNTYQQKPTPTPLAALSARERAQCGERYRELLDKFECESDYRIYGEFYEFGFRKGEDFLGHNGAPDGYWVYVYPHWYVWAKK